MLLVPFDDPMDGTAVPALGGAGAEFILVEAVGDFPGIESAFPQTHDDAKCLEFLGMANGLTALVLETIWGVPPNFAFWGDWRRFRGTLLDGLKNSRLFELGTDRLARFSKHGGNLFDGMPCAV